VLEHIDEAVSEKRLYRSEATCLGDNIYWLTRILPIFDVDLLYTVIEFENVTEAQQAMRKHVQSNETYHLLINTIKDYAIFMMDPTGHIVTWNTGAAILKQYSEQEIIGKHFSIFYSPDAVKAGVPHFELELAIRDGRFEVSGWRYRKDGSAFYANVVITPSYQNDVLVGFTKVTRDMTERNMAEVRLTTISRKQKQLNIDLIASHKQVEEQTRQQANEVATRAAAMQLKMAKLRIAKEPTDEVKDEPMQMGEKRVMAISQELDQIFNAMKALIEQIAHDSGKLADEVSMRTAELREKVAELTKADETSENAKDESNRVILDALRSKDEAVRANQLKSTFLASMSHEIRTPFNAVCSWRD